VSPCRAGTSRQCTAAPRRLPAADELPRFPSSELKRPSEQNDHADGERHDTPERRLSHLERCQCGTQRKDDRSEHRPNKEVPSANERRQPTDARVARPGHDLSVAPQHRRQGWQHHRYHHDDPHTHKRRRGPCPGLSGHRHPHHRHRCAIEQGFAAKHGHLTLGSALAILVMAPPPDTRLIASLGRAIQPLISTPQTI
jgi:hypothetical protein